uniref:Protein C15C8.6 n=1 Tax=Haemonchus contortus TaxID=6289 RepID=A0A7I4YTX2_HAECO
MDRTLFFFLIFLSLVMLTAQMVMRKIPAPPGSEDDYIYIMPIG